MARYDGPIIDAHHHLWDAALGRHPWMTDPDSPLKALGNMDFMRRSYLVADYLADAGAQPVVASVFVETGWDRTRPVEEEVRWLDGLERPAGLAARRVAWVDLASPGAAGALDRLGAAPGVVGVRETVRWHPDPAKSWARAGLMDEPGWRAGVAALAARGMLLELLMNPYQSDEVARLARDLPGLGIVVNHCASPFDRDAEGIARWHAGLAAMAARPNVAIKLSNFAAYGPDRTLAGLRQGLMPCIEAFGPARAMFGSDYPVGRRALPFQETCERFRDLVEDFPAGEQRALFHDTAARLYRFDF
jgi:predicted TIM-barrel fold metal-dependent hydrolase